MKTLIRSLLQLSLVVWLGAELFFPVVAAVTFAQLRPNTHDAGMIVGDLLHLLHIAGLAAGLVILALLALAPAWGIYKSTSVLIPMALVVAMLALTAWSQFGIIPSMERDRALVGGAIDSGPTDSPSRIDFDHLHKRSETVEGAIMLLGISVVITIASCESACRRLE